MKYLAVALLALAGGAMAAAQQSEPPKIPPADLRHALQQYHREGVTAPRHLTPAERAELRRQLSGGGPPPSHRRGDATLDFPPRKEP